MTAALLATLLWLLVVLTLAPAVYVLVLMFRRKRQARDDMGRQYFVPPYPWPDDDKVEPTVDLDALNRSARRTK